MVKPVVEAAQQRAGRSGFRRRFGGQSAQLRIWIDLDNTPHVTFFRPIIAELRRRGHDTLLTARADGQTLELARLFNLDCAVVGSGRGTRTASKVAMTGARALGLYWLARRYAPDLAVSHGSRALVLAAAAAWVPSVTLYDYEQVSAGLFHRLSRKVMVPACVPAEALSTRRSARERVVQYPGIKEQVYLSDFAPSRGLREQLEIDADAVMVVIRPESETAHYRQRHPRPILDAILRHLGTHPSVVVALVPRSADQQTRLSATLASLGLRFFVPNAIDGRDLICEADLVIGGGGTMTREAAALGVPAYSFFQGRMGAVDAYLAQTGRLVLVPSPDEVARIRVERCCRRDRLADGGRELLAMIVDEICSTAS